MTDLDQSPPPLPRPPRSSRSTPRPHCACLFPFPIISPLPGALPGPLASKSARPARLRDPGPQPSQASSGQARRREGRDRRSRRKATQERINENARQKPAAEGSNGKGAHAPSRHPSARAKRGPRHQGRLSDGGKSHTSTARDDSSDWRTPRGTGNAVTSNVICLCFIAPLTYRGLYGGKQDTRTLWLCFVLAGCNKAIKIYYLMM